MVQPPSASAATHAASALVTPHVERGGRSGRSTGRVVVNS
jgi:hypothetical protein